jgi:hypothetical protein
MRALSCGVGALIVLTAGFAIGQFTASRHDFVPAAVDVTEKLQPVELFRAGVKLVPPGSAVSEEDKTRAELLTQMAVNRQADDPRSIEGIWALLREFLMQGGESSEQGEISQIEVLTRLIAFQDAVEATFAASRTQSELDGTWKVRCEVAAEIDRHRKQATQDLAKEIATIYDRHKDTDEGAGKALSDFAKLGATNERRLLSIVAAVADSESDRSELKPVFDAVDQLLGLIDKNLEKIDSDSTSLLEAADEVLPTEKDGKPSDGRCEEELKKLDDLRAALDRGGLATWYSLKDQLVETGDKPGLDAVVGRIDPIQTRLLQAQRLRYSLWALRAIQNAETSDSWVGYLAQIEPSQLHPTVSALFGAVQDRRSNDLKEAGPRQRMVRQMLTDTKVELRQF